MVHREYAVVSDNGSNNAFTVNYAIINSKAYHDKYDGLTKHRAVNEALYKKAGEFLSHRNGTEYENIAILDSRTGEVLAENTTASGTRKFKCGLTVSENNKLIAKGNRFEIIHNHPGSTIPSIEDIEGLFNRALADASTIIGHDGTIYRMVKLKQFYDIESLTRSVYNEYAKYHSNYPENLIEMDAAELILKILSRKGYVDYVKR